MPNLISDSLSRPADVFLITWSCGRPAALDVHVISPFQQQTLGKAASTFEPCPASWYLSSHLGTCRLAGVEFIPVVMETLGGPAASQSFAL